MTRTALAGNGRSDQRWRRVARAAGGVAFALTPWLSLGFGTPIAFILAAALFSHLGRIHAVVLWLSATVYTAALIVEFTQIDAASGTTEYNVFFACVLITTVLGGLQALAFAVVAGVNGYRPFRGRATRAAPTEADPPVRTGTRAHRVLATLGLIILIALFPFVLSIVFTDASFQRHHQDARATITSVRVDTACSVGAAASCTDQYYPTVRFTTGRGENIEVETADFRAGDPSTVATGKTITVHYDPDDPRDARLGTGWDTNDIVFLGCVTITYGYLGYAGFRSRRQKSTGRHAA